MQVKRESTANQLKIMQQQLKILRRELGNFFDIFVEKALPYINGFLMALIEVVRYITKFVRELLGLPEIEFDYTGIGGEDNEYLDELVDGLEEANEEAEKLKKNLVGIDELNILQPQEDEEEDMGLDPEILNAFMLALEDWDNKMDETEMKAYKIRDAILSWIGLEPTEDGWGLKMAETRMYNILKIIKDIVEWWQKLDLPTFLDNLMKISDLVWWLFKLLLEFKFPLLTGILKMIEGFSELAKRGADFENLMDIIEGLGWTLFWIGTLLHNNVLTGIGLIIIGISKLVDDWKEAWKDGKLDLQELIKLLLDIGLVVLGLYLVGNLKTVVGWLMTCISFTWDFARAIVLAIGGSSAAKSALVFLINILKTVIAHLATIFSWVSIVAGAFGFFDTIARLINGTITPLQGFLRILKYIGLILLGISILLGNWAGAIAAGAVFAIAGIADANVTSKINAEKNRSVSLESASANSDISRQLSEIESKINGSITISPTTSTTTGGGYITSDLSSIGAESISTQSVTTSNSASGNLSEILNTLRTISDTTNSINNKDFSVSIDSREIARANTAGSQKLGTSQLGGVFANV